MLLTGKTYWNTNDLNGKLDYVVMSDGPNGLRKNIDGQEYPSTSMPHICVLSNTWSREMAYLEGETIANDCIDEDVDVLLGPGVNIKRTPLSGRNFEYFSEDPYLTGELSSEYINGLQDSGVGACIKHFCANNRDVERLYQSSEVDERTLREIYTNSFRNDYFYIS